MRTKRILLALLALLMLTAPALSLAESDYETGDGWVYRDGELKIVTNNGLINFLYHEYDMRGDPQHKHDATDVDHVIIGKDVTDIVIDYSIDDCNPTNTSVEEGNDTFIIDGGWVVNKKTNTLFGAVNVKQNKTRTVIHDLPNYIEHIGAYAFSYCIDLTEITIPKGVASIGEFSFDQCEKLETIDLPSRITSIGIGAFGECTSLKHINFGTEMSNIGTAAFFAGINLATPSFYKTKIEIIHGNSFWGCDQFRTVEFPSTLNRVEDQAFAMCENLNTLIFNSDQLIIENGAFTYCKNLKKLVFTKGKPTSIGTTMFNEDGKTPDGKCFITYLYDTNGEIIPYPTLYYTAAYASEWAPNGETEWNGYPIQQISQEELDMILAEARGKTTPEEVSPSPTPLPESTQKPSEENADASAVDGWVAKALVLAIVMVGVAFAVLFVRKKKDK